MTSLWCLAFALLLWGGAVDFKGFRVDYAGRDGSNAVKGFFVMAIFLVHGLLFLKNTGMTFASPDKWVFVHLTNVYGQLVVAPFLFYSGYGVFHSYLVEGGGKIYAKMMPWRRILPTIINFEVAVFLYLLLSVSMGHSFDVRTVLLSVVGLEDVGNPNWYVVVILILYCASYVAFMCAQKPQMAIGLLSVEVLALYAVLVYSFEVYWYNTLLCYLAGSIFALNKGRFDAFARKFWTPMFSLLFLSFAATYVLSVRLRVDYVGLAFNVCSILFMLCVVMLTMKVRFGNRAICWLGENVFPIYMYAVAPMLFLSERYPVFCSVHPVGYFAIVLVLTCLFCLFVWPHMRMATSVVVDYIQKGRR